MPCFTYIIYSPSKDRFYIGHTCDLIDERLRKHNANHKGFSGNSNDWLLAYSEPFETKSEAYAREREIKAWKSRKKIESLINS